MSTATKLLFSAWRVINLALFMLGMIGPWTSFIAIHGPPITQKSGFEVLFEGVFDLMADFELANGSFILTILCVIVYFAATVWLLVSFQGYDSRGWLLGLMYIPLLLTILPITLFIITDSLNTSGSNLRFVPSGFWLTCAALVSGFALEIVLLLRKNRTP